MDITKLVRNPIAIKSILDDQNGSSNTLIAKENCKIQTNILLELALFQEAYQILYYMTSSQLVKYYNKHCNIQFLNLSS